MLTWRTGHASRAAEAGEDLPPDGVVPVAEGRAGDRRVRGPGAAAQHLVLGAEEHLGVLAVREGLEAGVAAEVRRRPLPDLADAAEQAERCGPLPFGLARAGACPPSARRRRPRARRRAARARPVRAALSRPKRLHAHRRRRAPSPAAARPSRPRPGTRRTARSSPAPSRSERRAPRPRAPAARCRMPRPRPCPS